MSTLVEAKHAKLISPKDILFEFIDTLTHEIITQQKYMAVAKSIEKSLLDGEIKIASRDDEVQEWLDTIGFGETWLTSTGNWIYPVYTSLSGNKSDRYMNRIYSGVSKMLTGCMVENTVTLRNAHTFSDTDIKLIQNYLDMIGVVDKKDREKLLFVEGNGSNKQYMRLVVPTGSELISKSPDLSYTS